MCILFVITFKKCKCSCSVLELCVQCVVVYVCVGVSEHLCSDVCVCVRGCLCCVCFSLSALVGVRSLQCSDGQ